MQIIIGLVTIPFVFVAVISASDRLTSLRIITAIIFATLTSAAYLVREIVMQQEHVDPRKNTLS